jgi:hypothetical protein
MILTVNGDYFLEQRQQIMFVMVASVFSLRYGLGSYI